MPEASGTERQKASALADYLGKLTAELNLPTRLRDVGIAKADIAQLAIDAMKQTRLLVNNPRELTEADAVALYEEAL